MIADGRKGNPIVLNSDTDSDVLLKGSIAQPIMLSGSTTSSDVNSNNEKNTDSINFEEDCFSDDSSLNTEDLVYSRKRKEKKIHCKYNKNSSTNIDKGDMDAIELSFSDGGMSYFIE